MRFAVKSCCEWHHRIRAFAYISSQIQHLPDSLIMSLWWDNWFMASKVGSWACTSCSKIGRIIGPLWSETMDRNMESASMTMTSSCQAGIKANLSGITPRSSRSAVNHATIFINLVCESCMKWTWHWAINRIVYGHPTKYETRLTLWSPLERARI